MTLHVHGGDLRTRSRHMNEKLDEFTVALFHVRAVETWQCERQSYASAIAASSNHASSIESYNVSRFEGRGTYMT